MFMPQKAAKAVTNVVGAPLFTYAKEWWRTKVDGHATLATSPKKLHNAFTMAATRYNEGAGRARQHRVRGPIGVAIEAAEAVGWRPETAVLWRGSANQGINLRAGSPAMLGELCCKEYIRQRALAAVQATGGAA